MNDIPNAPDSGLREALTALVNELKSIALHVANENTVEEKTLDGVVWRLNRILAAHPATKLQAKTELRDTFRAALDEDKTLTWIRDGDGDNYVEASDVVALLDRVLADAALDGSVS